MTGIKWLAWLIQNWRLALGGVAVFGLGFAAGEPVGHWLGGRDAKPASVIAAQATTITETSKAQKTREKADAQTRSLDDTAVDAELRRHGWMRPEQDR